MRMTMKTTIEKRWKMHRRWRLRGSERDIFAPADGGGFGDTKEDSFVANGSGGMPAAQRSPGGAAVPGGGMGAGPGFMGGQAASSTGFNQTGAGGSTLGSESRNQTGGSGMQGQSTLGSGGPGGYSGSSGMLGDRSRP